LKPVNSEHAQGEQKIRPPGTTRQNADYDCGCEGSGDLQQSHLEALINPNWTAIRCEDEQCNHHQKKKQRPNVLGRCNGLPDAY
jgi:hypothetical protein